MSNMWTEKRQKLEKPSTWNSLLLHGIPYEKGEETDEVVLNFWKEKLDIELEADFIDRSHRLKSITTTKDGPKTIIVKFLIHDDKLWAYYTTKI